MCRQDVIHLTAFDLNLGAAPPGRWGIIPLNVTQKMPYGFTCSIDDMRCILAK